MVVTCSGFDEVFLKSWYGVILIQQHTAISTTMLKLCGKAVYYMHTTKCLGGQLAYADDTDAASGPWKALLNTAVATLWSWAVSLILSFFCAKKSYSSSWKMEHKSMSLNISHDSVRLKSVRGTEGKKEKSRSTFFTNRYFCPF